MDALDLIAKIKMDLTDYEKGLDDAKSKAESGGSSIGSAFGKLASGGVKVLTASVAAAATGVAALTTAAVKSYSEYEQLVGGVETLFGTKGLTLEQYANSVGDTVENVKAQYESLEAAQSIVMENASNAYKTAGMSANAYMEQATSTAAAMVNSLGGDTEEAAKLVDMAIIDMSDNANKMGTSMESIQNAYNGFAKGNYTMLDNLKLGYGGTKAEMERLLETAEQISGIEYDISSYADIVSAIHVVQEEMGITGTTSKEAADTITGSMASAKAAWDNLVNGLASGEDVTDLMNYFVDSLSTFVGNIVPIAEKALSGVGTLIENLIPKLMDTIPQLINDTLPSLIQSGISVTQSILDGIMENKDTVINGALDIITTLATSFSEMLPQFVEVGMQLFSSLVTGLAETAPDLIESAINAILGIADAILDNLDTILDAGLQLAMSLGEGLVQAIPDIINKLPVLIDKICSFISKNTSRIVEAGLSLLMGLLQAIPQVASSLANSLPQILNTIISTLTSMLPTLISQIVAVLPTIIQSIVDFFVNSVPQLLDAAITMLMALVDAVPEIITSLVDALPAIIDSVVDFLTGDGLPQVLDAAIEMFMAIVDAIPDIIDALAENLPEIITSIVEALVSSAPQILEAAVTALGEILSAIGQIILDIPAKMGEIIDSVLSAIGEWFTDLFNAAVEAFAAIGDGLVEAGAAIFDWIAELPGALLDAVMALWEDLKAIGKAIVEGIMAGLEAAWNWAKQTAASKFKELANEANIELEINSPSKVFMRIGKAIPEGLGLGIEKGFPKVLDEIDKYLDFDDVDATMGVNVEKNMDTAEKITASTTMKMSDADIDKIVKGLSVTLYNTTNIDSIPIKQEVYKYTIDKMGDETRALQLAQGGGY